MRIIELLYACKQVMESYDYTVRREFRRTLEFIDNTGRIVDIIPKGHGVVIIAMRGDTHMSIAYHANIGHMIEQGKSADEIAERLFNEYITDNHIRNNVDVFTDYKDYWHSTRN